MKLLLNQNLSYRIVDKIVDIFPDSKQVTQVGLKNKSDLEILKYAKENDFTVVTFDSDFYDLSLIQGIPPKIIWLRIGNTKTDNIAKILLDNYELIKSFINDDNCREITCLEIN